MKTVRDYKKKTYLGTRNGEKIYLTAPSWDCGWYWGFGYLGNNDCHYHVDGLSKDKNLHDGFLEHFGDSFVVRESDAWEFAELFQTFYALKETAEVLGRGGSHLTNNPCREIIKNAEEVKRINEVVLPAVFDAIYQILDRNENNGTLFKTLVDINNSGDTSAVVDFMVEHRIHTDDIEELEGITKHDFNVIHNDYWKRAYGK